MLTAVEKDHIMRVGWIVDHMLHYVRSNMAIYEDLPEKKQKCLKHIISMSVAIQKHYIIVDDELVLARKIPENINTTKNQRNGVKYLCVKMQRA